MRSPGSLDEDVILDEDSGAQYTVASTDDQGNRRIRGVLYLAVGAPTQAVISPSVSMGASGSVALAKALLPGSLKAGIVLQVVDADNPETITVGAVTLDGGGNVTHITPKYPWQAAHTGPFTVMWEPFLWHQITSQYIPDEGWALVLDGLSIHPNPTSLHLKGKPFMSGAGLVGLQDDAVQGHHLAWSFPVVFGWDGVAAFAPPDATHIRPTLFQPVFVPTLTASQARSLMPGGWEFRVRDKQASTTVGAADNGHSMATLITNGSIQVASSTYFWNSPSIEVFDNHGRKAVLALTATPIIDATHLEINSVQPIISGNPNWTVATGGRVLGDWGPWQQSITWQAYPTESIDVSEIALLLAANAANTVGVILNSITIPDRDTGEWGLTYQVVGKDFISLTAPTPHIQFRWAGLSIP